MEGSLLDELDGDLDEPSGMSQHHDEDSIDIYSGLENSPNGNGHRGNLFLSPRTKESMDIYEEIIREEQEEKEATHNELKQKFDAAQNQVKELLSKLQLLQTKNSSLSTENTLLKKNICSLIKTARMEMVRKDEEISRLSNRTGRGSYGKNFHRFQMESGQTNSRHSLNNATSSGSESRDYGQDKVMKEVNQHKRNIVPGHSAYPPTMSAVAPQPFEVFQRCPRTDLESPVPCQNKNSDSETLTIQPEQEIRHVHPNRTSGSIKDHTTSTATDVSNFYQPYNSGLRVAEKNSDNGFSRLEVNKICSSKRVDKLVEPQKHKTLDKECYTLVMDASQRIVDGNSRKSGSTERQLTKNSSVSSENKNQQPEVTVIPRSSERSKSPSSQVHKSLPSDVSSQLSKSSVKTAADVETQDQEHMHNPVPDRTSRGTRHSGWRSTASSVVDDASLSLKHKMEKRDASGQQRREEKSQRESSSSERRSTRTERGREHEEKMQKERKKHQGNSSSRERRSNRSESGKDYERRSAKEAENKSDNKRCREGRSRKLVDSSDSRQAISSTKCDSQKTDVCKGRASSSIDQPLLNNKKSHSHDNSRKMEDTVCPVKNASTEKDYGRGKAVDKDRERKRSSRVELMDGKSNNVVPTKGDRKNPFSELHSIVRESQHSKNGQDIHPKSISRGVGKTTEDNSANRKLSFMETLNLTLSPLKKQKPPSDPMEPIGATSEDGSADNSRLCDLVEEFFVIDELKNSQHSVEEMDNEPELTNADEQHDLTSSCKQSGQVDYLFTAVASEKPSEEETNMKVQEENALESHQAVDKEPTNFTTSEKEIDKALDFIASDKDSFSKLNLARESQSSIFQNTTEDSLEIIDNTVVSNTLPTKTSELTVSVNTPDSILVDDHQQKDPFSTVSEEISRMKIQRNPQPKAQDLLPEQNGIFKENVSSSGKKHCIPESNSGNFESFVTMEVSSSTNSANIDCQSKVICDVEVGTSTQDNHRAGDTFESLKSVEISQASENLKTSEKKLRDWDTTAPNDTTVREEAKFSVQAGSSEPDSTENDEQILKPSSPVVFLHDEDSMMLTLRNIRVIPEPISPLTSPVRQVKKVEPHHAENQPHVKSLIKDLSVATSGSDKDEVNIDMNKENKSPASSVTPTSQKGTKDGLSASGTVEEELEDGEIVSESEEEGPLFIQTPPREKDKSTSVTQPGPRLSAGGKRVSQKQSKVSAKCPAQTKSPKTTASDGSSTSSKRRFKTVSPPLNTAVHTLDEFMDMLATIRVELRKKYMKLHKNVTKTAFCCIVDMSHVSFTEFINSVDLDKLGCQGNVIKVRLNKIISSILNKVTKNGIVNRIFEQRAGDLKQKLWKFVNGQFDFLFKELKTAIKSGYEPFVNACLSENKSKTLKGKVVESEVVEKEMFSASVHSAKKANVDTGNCGKEAPPNNILHRGLGSRGKNIKASMAEDDQLAKITSHQHPTLSSQNSGPESTSGSENKISSYVHRLSHNGSVQERSDFDILTEQQASSLTFNLVSDSQMGEIFKCLLQGSDLLDPSVPVGDNQSWPVSTPRKEGLPGESLIGIMTPNKTTPSKFITAWSSFSPYKFASNGKMLVDPAILDENCLLEVPSNSELCQVPSQSSIISQSSFSILAEDLAVSLTIPSPLKSDSHLSFLHPGTGQPLSAPNSVLSAHYSEDALLDGEDATEQDIHLSLDTDNSSCGSSPSRTWEGSDPCGFQFKPNLPMQAVVMERSNDHFVVRIRHTSTSPSECNQNEGKRVPALAEGLETYLKPNLCLTTHEDVGPASGEISDKSPATTVSCDISDKGVEDQTSSQKSPSEGVCDDNLFGLSSKNVQHFSKEACVTVPEGSSATEPKTTINAMSTTRSQSAQEKETERVSRKRKGHNSESKAKRCRIEKSQDKHHKSKHKKRSKSHKEKGSKTAVTLVSPSSLSAKNVIKRNGEVVVTWTRDEDRDILIELKMKGASPKTFAALSKRLKKSTEQIEERFTQLMKLFKKKEKMEN